MKRNNGLVLALTLAVMVVLLSLTGCGGSGSGTTASSNTPAEEDPTFFSGQIIDSVVAGLSYRTNGRSGTTDGNGTFFYQAGERISST